jgi:hypothetical protein
MNIEVKELITYLKKLNFSEPEILELLQTTFGADQRTK